MTDDGAVRSMCSIYYLRRMLMKSKKTLLRIFRMLINTAPIYSEKKAYVSSSYARHAQTKSYVHTLSQPFIPQRPWGGERPDR